MADDDDDGEKPTEDDLGTYTPSAIDIDAIASAKSLGDAMRLLAPQLEGLPRRSRGKYGKRKHLTPEEKAELTRRRNRENARSTRMRRKMYIKHLQQVAETLKERHDELNSKIAAPPPDGYTRRRDSVRRFFELRGALERDPRAWAEVVDDAVEFTLPPTPYRAFSRRELERPALRVVHGVDQLAADVASLADCLAAVAAARADAAAKRRRRDDGRHAARRGVGLRYEIDAGSIVHVGEQYMCAWTAHLTLPDDAGVLAATVAGMAKCAFSADHRLSALHLRFDALSFMNVLRDLQSAPAPPPS